LRATKTLIDMMKDIEKKTPQKRSAARAAPVRPGDEEVIKGVVKGAEGRPAAR
jgi:hypothetical protein